MDQHSSQKPVVLVLAGHDPSGGAGLQADIETLAALGCISTSVVTSLTAQNTQSFSEHLPQTKLNFMAQGKLVLDDIDIDACKIGAIGSAELIQAIHEMIVDQTFFVVLDPVLYSTSGHEFANDEICGLFSEFLFPLTTIITPNRDEAMQLTGELEPQAAAEKFFEMGCNNILITDAEDSSTQVINHLFEEDGQHQTFSWERLAGSFHGSGCTLASAISANLARGFNINAAVAQAQDYTWHSLKHGLQIGHGQMHPNRFFNQIENK